MFDNKWQKKEMPLVSLIGMGGGIASPAFLASIVLNILKPTVFSPADDTGVPDFDYTAESSAITNVGTVDVLDGSSFSITSWSGNDSNDRTIQSGIDNTEDSLIWIKSRTMNGGDHVLTGQHLVDAGYTNLDSSGTSQAGTEPNYLKSFLDNGFVLGNSGYVNGSGNTYIGWNFLKTPGFFDVVTWTGDGSGTRDINHSLGSEPAMMIWKKVNATSDWSVYHKDVGTGYGLYLNTTNSKLDTSLWGTGPTTTSFPAHTAFNLVSEKYVAYLFADNPSNQIKCGSYLGNATGGGTPAVPNQIDCGFRPKFVLIKNAGNTADWLMFDDQRGDRWLKTNESDSEGYGNPAPVVFNDTGFSLPTGYHYVNQDNTEHIFMAIGAPQATVSATQLTLTDTTVSKVSDGSLIGGTTIDQVLTVGETVQADTTVSSTVTVPVFSTTTYSYTSNPQTIANGIDLAGEGGLIWTKWRSGGAYSTESHCLIDTERSSGSSTDQYGTFTPYLRSDQISGQTNAYYFNFNSDGYEIITPSSLVNHDSGGEYVSWTFRKAAGFFDIVTYSGTGSVQNISHSLGTTPGMMIVKRTDASAAWAVYHKDVGASSYMMLSSTGGLYGGSGHWDDTAPTSSVFTLRSDPDVNQNGGNYVAYLFADNPDNQITCGSYVGAGYGGKLVTLGFKPHWLMIKKATGTGDWAIVDSTRGNFNELYPNSNSAESTGSSQILVDFNPNGFYIDSDFNNGGTWDNNGETYIYVAIGNGEVDITTQSTATGEVSASSGNTITLSNVSGTWSTGMKVQGVSTDTKDNPDPIKVEDVSLTSSAPTAERNVNTWGDAIWEIATDENFTQNVQTATTALSATGTQAGPSFTLERETGYYTRTKYTALGQESEWSDVTYFVTRARYVDSFWINTFNHNGWDYEYTEGLDSDDNGNVYVISIRYSAGGSGYKGMSLVKLDPNGDIQWQKYLTYNIPGDRTYPLESRTVSVTPDGSEIFVTAQGDLGMLVCKFNSDGDLQWTKKLGGVNSNNFSYGTTLTSSGELVMLGMDSQNSLSHTFVTQISNTGSQTFYSSIGRTSGDTTQLVYTCEPFVDTDDNIHFVINSWNGSKRTPGVVKYDSSGVLQSVSDFNSTVDNSIADEDQFGDIAVDGSGNKYITYRRDATATHVSGMRSGLLKLNSSDEIQWQSEISGSDPIYPLQVNIDSSGDIVSAFQDRRTNSAIIITKHTSDGTLVWKRSFRHTSREINPNAEVRINRNDNILLNSHIYGDVKTIVCQFPSDGSLTGSYMATVGYFNWEDATHITVSSSTAYFKNGSSIYSAKSTSMSMSSFSNTNTGDNILTVNEIDIPTP